MMLETLSIERVSGEWVILEEGECARGRVERRRCRPFVAAAVDRLQHDVASVYAVRSTVFPTVVTSCASRVQPLCLAQDSTLFPTPGLVCRGCRPGAA